MHKSISLFLVLILTASLLSSCSKSELSKTYVDSFSKQYSNKFIVQPAQYKFTNLNNLTPSNIKLPNDDNNLSFVQNLPKLDNSCMDALRKYHFYVNETDCKEFYDIYEDNNILPTFITTDSVAHSYHQIFDYSLKLVEQKYLSTLAKKLSEDMLTSSINIYNNVKDQRTKKAALKNIAYFNTAEALSNGKINEAIPSEALSMTNAELKSINEAKGYEDSSIFPYQIDYSQFKVRGHYTENEALQRYFKTMMWFSNVPFAFEITDNDKTVRANEQIIQSALITDALFTSKSSDTWDNIYSITSFFSGESDDLTPYEYKNLLLLVYGKNLSETNLWDEVKLNKFVELSKKVRQPLIGGTSEGRTGSVKVIDGEITLTSTQFRFMGQRYLLDSEAFYNLTKVDDKAYRPFPKGLDFPAVLGNDRALNILTNYYKEQQKYPDYPKKIEELKEKVKAIPETQWNSSNLYNAWIWTNKALIDDDKKYYPDTLKCEGWQDKSLNSFLGNWAEIRHDVILYAKESEPLCTCALPLGPLGYVEPNVEFYERLDYTLSWLKSNLEKTKLLKESELAVIDYFINEVQFLRDISLKEIKGENISTDEMDHIKNYNNTLKTICLSIIDSGKYSIPEIQDNGMGVIADVHNYNGNCLEVGVGNPSKIYAIVPIQGKWYIAKGAVYSYYEFLQPTSNRLTDNEWKQLLNSNNKQKIESWFKKYYEAK